MRSPDLRDVADMTGEGQRRFQPTLGHQSPQVSGTWTRTEKVHVQAAAPPLLCRHHLDDLTCPP